MNALSFGEILWDVYPDKKFLGGAPLNFAAHLKKHDENVYMMSAVGNDELGKEALKCIENLGVHTSYILSLDDKPTGRCMVTLDENKVPAYNLLNDVAYDYISYKGKKENFDVLYFGTLALRSENNYNTLKELIKSVEFKYIFSDINIRPPFYSEKTVRFAAENANVLKISIEELQKTAELLNINYADYKDFCKKISSEYKNLKLIIITLGKKGAYAFDCKNNKDYFCDSIKVEEKSTVGAGDSFSAAFMHKYIKKESIENCLIHASKIAGFVVSEYDAIPEYNIEDLI